MTVMQRVVKPRTQRAKRALENREPKILENSKQCLFLHGQKASEVGRQCLSDLYALKKQGSQHLHKKLSILPFEDILPIERLSQKHDASLFAFTSHSKKRPNNLILGRTFDSHVLDMFELGVEDYFSLSHFNNSKVSSGTKPVLLFSGLQFDSDPLYGRLKNLLVDFFRGVEATEVRLQGFEHALSFTSLDGKVLVRSYRILMKKSGTRLPRVELEEIGPSMSLSIRRNQIASDDLFRRACKQPKQLKKKRVKNMDKDVFGTQLARIHMTPQDLGKLQTRKMKALKKPPKKTIKAAKEGQGEAVKDEEVMDTS